MTNLPEFFKGFKITNYYQYILYISGVVLLFSLFLDVKELNDLNVRKTAFWAIVSSLGIWLFEEGLVSPVNDYLYQKKSF